MQPHRVSSHRDVERLAAHEPLTCQVRSQNPEAVTAPLELGTVRIEHPEEKRPAGPIEKEHDSVTTGPPPAVTDRDDTLGVEHPVVPGLEHEIVVTEAMPLEERRASAGRVTLWQSHIELPSSVSEVVFRLMRKPVRWRRLYFFKQASRPTVWRTGAQP